MKDYAAGEIHAAGRGKNMGNRQEFVKRHPYLVCLDSDGCAIDGMTIKHLQCFGPCAVAEWGLLIHQEELLEYWNEVNLYRMSRGINRFKGLALLLRYAKEKGYIDDELECYQVWVDSTTELSEAALEKEIARRDDEVLKKALEWSRAVNRAVAAIPRERKPAFEGVRETLAKAHARADVAVISAANAAAVAEEWGRNGLLEFVDICMTQEYGSKAECIGRLLQYGYIPEQVVMLGDAPGDYEAASKNGVSFFPILAGNEAGSWKEFGGSVFDMFLQNKYSKKIQKKYLDEFERNLS